MSTPWLLKQEAIQSWSRKDVLKIHFSHPFTEDIWHLVPKNHLPVERVWSHYAPWNPRSKFNKSESVKHYFNSLSNHLSAEKKTAHDVTSKVCRRVTPLNICFWVSTASKSCLAVFSQLGIFRSFVNPVAKLSYMFTWFTFVPDFAT